MNYRFSLLSTKMNLLLRLSSGLGIFYVVNRDLVDNDTNCCIRRQR